MAPRPVSDGGPPDPEVIQDAASTFGLLSATVRLELLWVLAAGENDVGTLAEQVGQTVATVSHHLGKLKLAGLVSARRAGRHQFYAVDDPHVVEMVRLAVAHHEELRHLSPAERRRREA
ncbi:metalloregulator ArsR/SmtB family transcription factor [Actinomycetospora endophytica]|uniref:Metalloregulator ArsR/SmtB family transcription factor n=1 Tax=Actinomycetospora endophytica TaxID=2291215 RepID=A0ABS8PB92_9PSEU|nr:metalloregulator ArsR/SmtB family transcription factor [Actinomycetospora endophytica]MCD2195187.1 metalloregulator ArsR/SmtB family transcription factor [Actinomycetospora endophytica]